MKAIALTVQKLWPRLEFLKNSLKVKVKSHRAKKFGSNGKILSEGIYMCNMKGLARMVQKLWPKLKFLKSGSRVKVKGHRSNFLIPIERPCLQEYICEI